MTELYFGIFTTSDPLVQLLLNIMRGLLVLVVALVLARFVKRWTVRLFTKSRVNLSLATLLGNMAQVVVVLLGVILMLPSFGVDWAGLLTLVGVGGLAISLSMQDLLKNVVAGIYILMEQPFRIGDRISVKEVTGTVQGVELRTTILCTEENLQVVVPNSIVLNEIVTNRSASNLQRQVITVRILRGSLSTISKEIDETLKAFPDITSTPAPVITLESIQEGAARLRVEYWTPAQVRVALMPQVIEALQVRFPEADVTVV
ncbi:MAG: mechanosensitive ion channel domain-containing protein [Chloroflexia bacterium]